MIQKSDIQLKCPFNACSTVLQDSRALFNYRYAAFMDNSRQINIFYDLILYIILSEDKGAQSNMNMYSDR